MILFVSGSRADFGYLEPIRAAMGEEMLRIAPTWGSEAVDIAIGSGTSLVQVAAHLERTNPEMMVVLGDRWEILSACQAAVLAGVPIAHIGSGEITLGSYDDKFRSAIEAMSDLHFCLTKEAYDRMDGKGSILAGCTSVKPPPMLMGAAKTAILALYPETRGQNLSGLQSGVKRILEASGLSVSVIGSNPDVGAAGFWGESWELYKFHVELTQAAIIVGNSSAGIIEAPILGTPSVNIGKRQFGRPQAPSVFQADPDLADIERQIGAALAFGKKRVVSPYYREGAVQIIVHGICDYLRGENGNDARY